MNPPPILEIDEELLDLFKQACEKYLASDNSKLEIVSIVTTILLGEQWVDYEKVNLHAAASNAFNIGLHTILPTSSELRGCREPGRDKWNENSYKILLAYLTDTEYNLDK